ncbi:GNAT family N-acetyltransferase [Hamadaea tsunoensis]|uniref:GNAT family N-acetyltransferase n=1 Tax=Hamadaea tsunoensis TaxID=53368 RepID=UPI0004243AC5|nr:GNAT family N-acetyltransferase [Hamadaea tsunoensis]
MELRPAGVHEVEAVLEFWRYAAEGTDRDDRPEAVAALIARDPDALILAVDNGQIVGSLIAGWDGWRASLYRFAVDPARRRQGIGSRLVAAAEQRLASLGARRADAMVLNANEQGHLAWSAAGYTRETNNARWVKRLP